MPAGLMPFSKGMPSSLSVYTRRFLRTWPCFGVEDLVFCCIAFRGAAEGDLLLLELLPLLEEDDLDGTEDRLFEPFGGPVLPLVGAMVRYFASGQTEQKVCLVEESEVYSMGFSHACQDFSPASHAESTSM